MEPDKLLTQDVLFVLQSLPIAILIEDINGVLIYANNTAARMIGFTDAQELLSSSRSAWMSRLDFRDEEGKPLSLVNLPGHEASLKRKLSERIVRYTVVATGEQRWSLVKANPLMYKHTFLGVINMFFDLTPLKSTEQKLRFLTHATSTLAESLSYEQRLQKLVHLIVPQFADWCTVDMLDVDGNLKRLVVAHPDPQLVKEVEASARRYPEGIGSTKAVSHVINTGKMELYAEITPEMLSQVTHDKNQLELLEKLHIRSVAIVPLIARKKTLGAITFVRSYPHERYEKSDMNFFLSLATKAALSVDNARLHATLLRETQKSREIFSQLRENEKALQLALEVGNMGVWDWEIRSGELTQSNSLGQFPSMPHGTGQVSSKDFLRLVHPLDRTHWEKTISQAIKQIGLYENEFRMQYPDKSKRWIFSKGEVLPDGIGNPSRLIGVSIDITKRKKIEETLRLSERKFRTIFKTALDGMIIFDDRLQIRDANPAACMIFQISHTSIIKKKLPALMAPGQRHIWLKEIEQLKLRGEKKGEIEIKSRGGIYKIVEYNAIANIFASRHLAIMRDISDRKLEEKRSAHFLGIVSHELKSPLASIKAIDHLLKTRLNRTKSASDITYVDKIDKKVDSLTYLINDLLDVTRIRQGKLEFIYEQFNIDSLIKNIIEEIRLSAKNHKIIRNLEADTDIIGDRLRISQVLRNIIRNSIKFAPQQTNIMISSIQKKTGILIRCKDEGSGVPHTDRHRIFDLYYQGSDSNSKPSMGLGVGLYISSQIIKQHGGRLWESGNDKGAVFNIFLPFKPKKISNERILF